MSASFSTNQTPRRGQLLLGDAVLSHLFKVRRSTAPPISKTLLNVHASYRKLPRLPRVCKPVRLHTIPVDQNGDPLRGTNLRASPVQPPSEGLQVASAASLNIFISVRNQENDMILRVKTLPCLLSCTAVHAMAAPLQTRVSMGDEPYEVGSLQATGIAIVS